MPSASGTSSGTISPTRPASRRPAERHPSFLANQRLSSSPSATLNLTAADQQVSFAEAFADWFAVSGAEPHRCRTNYKSLLKAITGFQSFGELRHVQRANRSTCTVAEARTRRASIEGAVGFGKRPQVRPGNGKSSEREVFEAAKAATAPPFTACGPSSLQRPMSRPRTDWPNIREGIRGARAERFWNNGDRRRGHVRLLPAAGQRRPATTPRSHSTMSSLVLGNAAGVPRSPRRSTFRQIPRQTDG